MATRRRLEKEEAVVFLQSLKRLLEEGRVEDLKRAIPNREEFTFSIRGKSSADFSVAWYEETRRQIEEDPRRFGDSDTVVARALRDWYPGKTTSYQVGHIFVFADVPGLGHVEVAEDYFPNSGFGSSPFSGLSEAIIGLLKHKLAEQEREKETQEGQLGVEAIKRAFDELG